jgi:SAM-dependent methyltransferase
MSASNGGDVSNEDYFYTHAGCTGTDDAVNAAVLELLRERAVPGARILEIGCGNGHFAGRMSELGFDVTGVDTSISGIAQAQAAQPRPRFAVAGVESLAGLKFAAFDVVVRVEVIEHCPSTREFCEAALQSLRPGGFAIITTPYHGYWKNLAIALLGRHDRHFDPLWEGGHLKFFSIATMSRAFADAGFSDMRFSRIGRIAPLAKSMLMCAVRAGDDSGRQNVG